MRLSRQDVRLAIRSFARHPGFTITAVLSLALAIALNTTMYSVLDALVNPATDVREPDRVYAVQFFGDFRRHLVDDATRASWFREASNLFAASTFSRSRGLEAGGIEFGNRYAQVPTLTVHPNYFEVLGVRATRGRGFSSDDKYASSPPVLITEKLAATLSPDRDFPVGESIQIDGVAHPVIGIVRQGMMVFALPPATVVPSAVPPTLVRLRDGVEFHDAEKQIGLISSRFAEMAREDPKATGILIKPAFTSQFQLVSFHYALAGAVMAVLLIACANLANLQLARGLGRSRELALRAALGASRRDIVTQLLIESALLAVAGLVLGLLLTFWGMHLVAARIPDSVALYTIQPRISWRLVAFAITACVVCAVLIGLYPALRVSRVDPNELLKSGAGTGANTRNRRQYGIMVAAEIGLSLALLSAAAIVVRTALRVREIPIGFDPKPLAAASVVLRSPRDTAVSSMAFSNALLSRIRAIPDVADATVFESRGVEKAAVTVDERGGPPRQIDAPAWSYRVVSPSYFRTYGLRVVKGRDFLEGAPGEPEAIISRETAARLWPGVDPIGMRIKLGAYETDRPWVRVVGVVQSQPNRAEDVRTRDLGSSRPQRLGEVYVLMSAADSIALGADRGRWIYVTVRAKTDPARLPVTLRRYLPRSDLVWIIRTMTMEESLYLVQTRQSHDFVASLFSLFAALAVGLAALGVYGIVTHTVNERKRELGVRLALGATARDIVYCVIRDGNPMVLAGVALGLLLIKQTVTWLHSFSIDGDEYDALLFATMGALLFVVALGSALVPALRATRIDPVESLRSE
jgi:putative ABC transport system permease protein